MSVPSLKSHQSDSLPRPRIVYLVPGLPDVPGGIQRHTFHVARALEELCCSVTLISLHGHSSVGDGRTGTRATTCDAFGGRRSAFVLAALRASFPAPALVLVEHPHFAALGWTAGCLSRAPVAVFVHGIEVWDRLPVTTRMGLRSVDRILSVSRFTAERAIEANGLDGDGIRILPNCIECVPDQQPRVRDSSQLSLLTVSRLGLSDAYKGHSQVIRSLPALVSRFPTLAYHIVGDGEGRPALQALAVECGVGAITHFHGQVDEEELSRIYTDADIFVMPSSGEGFGLVFLEAMARGLPVVAGNVDATPEVVIHGETGLLVDPASPDALAQALAGLLGNPQLRTRMGIAAVHHVRDSFGFERFRDLLATCLSELGVEASRLAQLPEGRR